MAPLDLLRATAPAGWPEAMWADVERAYASPGRHYHTLLHLAQMAQWYRRVAEGPGWRQPRAVFLALLAHDAVYDVARADNEARSAAQCHTWATAYRLEVDANVAERLVVATAGHRGDSDDGDPDLAHFLDCDLAILGAPAPEYDAYAAGVAAEYLTCFDPVLYRQGRAHFLRELLARPFLFHSALFRSALEATARGNVRRELAQYAQTTEN